MNGGVKWNNRLYFLIIFPSGSIYKLNRIGSRMDPWGTPQDRGAEEEECRPMDTENDLWER